MKRPTQIFKTLLQAATFLSRPLTVIVEEPEVGQLSKIEQIPVLLKRAIKKVEEFGFTPKLVSSEHAFYDHFMMSFKGGNRRVNGEIKHVYYVDMFFTNERIHRELALGCYMTEAYSEYDGIKFSDRFGRDLVRLHRHLKANNKLPV